MSGDWRDLALCAEIGTDLWYPEKEEGGSAAEPAKAMCRRCESRLPCLKDALQRPGEEGVWGGFSERIRHGIAREHAAGKSLEDIIAEDDAVFYARLEVREAIGHSPEDRKLAAQRRRRQEKREAADRTTQASGVAA